MKRASPLILVALVLTSLGLHGCTHQKNGAVNAKVREMEARYAKLEEDYRAVTALNEAGRKRLGQAEADKADLKRQVDELQAVVQERDELKKQIAARTTERDAVQAQMAQFSKDLQALAGRIEAAANAARPGPEVIVIPASRQSQ